MTYTSSISPEHRTRLRQLRAEFDKAFDLIDDPADHSSLAYRQADACFRKWTKAINAVAIQLLDDVDAFEATVVPFRTSTDPLPQGGGNGFETSDLHSDFERYEHARGIVGTPDPDIGDPRLFSGMPMTLEAIEAGTLITGLRGAALARYLRKGNSSLS